MRYIKKIFILVFVLFVGLSFVKVSADDYFITSDIYIEGASVRITGNPGIRFQVNIGTLSKEGVEKYGVLIAFGSADANADFCKGGEINGKPILSVEVDEVDENGNYFATIFNVPTDQYGQDISVRPYFITEMGDIFYCMFANVRNMVQVASAAAYKGVESEFIENIMEDVEIMVISEEDSCDFFMDSFYGDGKGNWILTENYEAIVNKDLKLDKTYVCLEYHEVAVEEDEEDYDLFIVYKSNVNAFNSIVGSTEYGVDKEVAVADEKYKDQLDYIYVFSGLYEGDVVIDKCCVNYCVCSENGFNLEYDDEFVQDETKQVIIDGSVTITGNYNEISGFVFDGVVEAKGVDGLGIESCVFNLTDKSNYSFAVKEASSNVGIYYSYKADASNRFIYLLAETTNLTVDGCTTLDQATTTDGIRFSDGTDSFARGDVTIIYNYIEASQFGFCDRSPDADKYEIINNYFGGCETAIQLRNRATPNANDMVYEIFGNAFDGCGAINDGGAWNVCEISTGAKTVLNLNYNVFVNSTYKTSGGEIIYIYKNEDATFDCSNNYFWNTTSEDTSDFDNAGVCNIKIDAGLTLWELCAPSTCPMKLPPYFVVDDGVNYYIYGINIFYSEE